MADRIGVINHGELIVVEVSARDAQTRQEAVDADVAVAARTRARCVADLPLDWRGGHALVYTSTCRARKRHRRAAQAARRARIDFKDLHSSESSLEEIFVSLVRGGNNGDRA